MVLQIDYCPWKVPVAVERGRFAPLHEEHEVLNVQVVPRAARAGRPPPCDCEPPLLADLQVPFYANLGGSLGSGRAGFYRGWYLKGVGKTPLAASWEPADASHAPHASPPGQLNASSAIRELVISLYLKERGGGDSIVPCEGVLLATLDPALASHHRTLHARTPPEQVPPVDRHLQAMTVQPGGFARQSNFVWLLHHLVPTADEPEPGRHSLAVFCRLLAGALAPDEGDGRDEPEEEAAPQPRSGETAERPRSGEATPQPRSKDITPAYLVALLERTTLAALDRFRLWFERGVWWGAFHNHFTIDGRFLDLERPALLGGPCLGRLSTEGNGAAWPVYSTVIGLEQLSFLAQTRGFAFELRRALRQLPPTFSRAERDLADELATAIEELLLAPDRLLGSRDQALQRVLAMVEDAFGTLSAVERTLVRSVVEAGYTSSIGQDGKDPAGRASSAFAPVPDLPYLLTGPGQRWRPWAVALEAGRLLQPSEEQRRTARHFAELIADLDHTTELAALLDKLAALCRDSAARTAAATASR